jgi:hypothetical protein
VAISYRVDLTPGPGGARIVPLGSHTATARAVVGDGLGPWALAQFVVLAPSRQIGRHCDPPIVGQRYHIPLLANPECWSFHGGVWQQLTIGGLYEMDPTVAHGAVNWGTTPRLHLMIDTES